MAGVVDAERSLQATLHRRLVAKALVDSFDALLQIAVDDPFLMRVLDAVADLYVG